MRSALETTPLVALITGGTGFLGKALISALLDEGYHVLALVRDAGKVVYKDNKKSMQITPARERLEGLKKELNLTATAGQRLHCISGDLADLDRASIASQIRHLMDKVIGTGMIDTVISCAARLNMDYTGQDPEKAKTIRDDNQATNVDGLARMIEVLNRLAEGEHGSRAIIPNVRIMRPSIVAGKDSQDAYMAFIQYLNKDLGSAKLIDLAREKFSELPAHLVVPMPGNPDSIIDIIGEEDVNRAIMAMVDYDRKKRPVDEDLVAHRPGEPIRVRNFHQISTAYVNGSMTGKLTETPLPPEEVVGPQNSYEATKAAGERLLGEWVRQRIVRARSAGTLNPDLAGQSDESILKDYLQINQIANPNSRSAQTVVKETMKAFGWSDQEADRIRLIQDRSVYEKAVLDLKVSGPFVYKIMKGLWRSVPMLNVYFTRQPGTTFCVQNTTDILGRQGLLYNPAQLNAHWIAGRLLDGPVEAPAAAEVFEQAGQEPRRVAVAAKK